MALIGIVKRLIDQIIESRILRRNTAEDDTMTRFYWRVFCLCLPPTKLILTVRIERMTGIYELGGRPIDVRLVLYLRARSRLGWLPHQPITTILRIDCLWYVGLSFEEVAASSVRLRKEPQSL